MNSDDENEHNCARSKGLGGGRYSRMWNVSPGYLTQVVINLN